MSLSSLASLFSCEMRAGVEGVVWLRIVELLTCWTNCRMLVHTGRWRREYSELTGKCMGERGGDAPSELEGEEKGKNSCEKHYIGCVGEGVR